MSRYTLHDSLGYWMNRVASQMHESFDQAVADLDMTAAQWAVIATVARSQQSTPGEIAEYIGIHGGSVTRLLDRLVDKGFVERISHPTDRRALIVRLTSAGKALVPKLEKRSKTENNRFLERLEPDVRATFVEHLKRLARV